MERAAALRRIHVTGASGSGTTTLGWALSRALGVPRFDSDFYYWSDSWPYRVKRDPGRRNAMLLADLRAHDAWIESGSLDSWGREIDALFDLVVYLDLPAELRVARLAHRSSMRYAVHGGDRETWLRERGDFLDWAAAYDRGDREGRTRARHAAWMETLRCPVLRLEGDRSVPERVQAVLAYAR